MALTLPVAKQPAGLRVPMQPAGFRSLVQPRASPYEQEESAQLGRREMMSGLASFATAGALLKDRSAQAAYGDGANV